MPIKRTVWDYYQVLAKCKEVDPEKYNQIQVMLSLDNSPETRNEVRKMLGLKAESRDTRPH